MITKAQASLKWTAGIERLQARQRKAARRAQRLMAQGRGRSGMAQESAEESGNCLAAGYQEGILSGLAGASPAHWAPSPRPRYLIKHRLSQMIKLAPTPSSLALLLLITPILAVAAAEYHVAVTGADINPGTAAQPFRTIQHGAAVAQPGDTVTVHAGIYRERIDPPRGGMSDTKRIVYQAAPGEIVDIRGSEVVQNWSHVSQGVWKTEIPNTLFGAFNPFADEVSGPWFNPQGPKGTVLKDGEWLNVKTSEARKHHSGCVYLNGEWLFEAADKNDLFMVGARYGYSQTDKAWFAEVGNKSTTVFGNFGGKNPNDGVTEVNVRQTVFYPSKPFINYLTVRGFTMRQAAPKWAPPTLEQMGLIGTHWSRGWIIENNVISHSINVGVSLGKYGDQKDQLNASNRGYLDTILRAYNSADWNKEHVGSHIVRNNEISYCEQAGIVGSLGCIGSSVIGNHIHHIYTQRRFSGAEMAAIKFHAAIDAVVENNRIHDAFLGVWLDWMAQGSIVRGNLLYRNDCHDLYFEVNHGPYSVYNNICLSSNCRHLSEGGAFAHNLFGGQWGNWSDARKTPYFRPHTTTIVEEEKGIEALDDRFYNNIFIGKGKADSLVVVREKPENPYYYSWGLRCYEKRPLLPEVGGNVYCFNAEPTAHEKGAVRIQGNPDLKLIEVGNEAYLEMTLSSEMLSGQTQLVTTELLGMAKVPQQLFTNADGSPLVIDKDYFGNQRNLTKPTPGPFEQIGTGLIKLRVWPK